MGRTLLARSALIVAMIALWLSSCGSNPTSEEEDGIWVSAIRSTNQWAAFPCTDYLITNSCGIDKDYSDPGSLPPIIAIGNTITYVNKDGESKSFAIRQINYFMYEKDVDFTYAGKRYVAKKGDTSCTLFDVESRSDTVDTAYPSRIVIKGCGIAE